MHKKLIKFILIKMKINNPFLPFLLVIITFSISSCKPKKIADAANSFSFVFMTDIHLQPEKNAPQGFQMAIDSVNSIKPDFVITGGDLIMDALGVSYGRADSLFKMYDEMIKNLTIPVYNTIGNHEIYGIYSRSGANPSHPEYGEKMYENRLGKSYYAFNYKGWKFMIINSIEDTKKSRYIGWVDSTQINWIKEELNKTDKSIPIAIVSHIPFITVFEQTYNGSTYCNDSSLVVANSKDVTDLFRDHNLKLVLQGHLHTVEDIYVDGIHFITGGAISGRWWNGPNKGHEEGFVIVKVIGDSFEWEYKDYGWDVAQ